MEDRDEVHEAGEPSRLSSAAVHALDDLQKHVQARGQRFSATFCRAPSKTIFSSILAYAEVKVELFDAAIEDGLPPQLEGPVKAILIYPWEVCQSAPKPTQVSV